jgi:tetraacyldisaccharide 4'-kinase
MNLMRLLLTPVSLLYGFAVACRNWLYDSGIIPPKEFKISVIAIGNLSVGGTGKSPMTEYLIQLLKERFLLATLSRGYKRHTKGIVIAENNSTSFQIGDEPLQFKKKFPDVIVAVAENRKHGIQKLLDQFPKLKVILLDDAFQHRKVKPGLSLLLTDYNKMFYDDFLLPSGMLREWKGGKKRADIFVVTKCPYNLTPVEKRIILRKVSPDAHQHILFSHIKYGELIPLFTSPPLLLKYIEEKNITAILFTGISNPKPLEDFLLKKKIKIISHSYPDHHEFTFVEATTLVEKFNSISSPSKIIITTEKDAMRLDTPGLVEVLCELPMYYIPIETTFDEKEKGDFDQLITDYVIRTKHA